MKKKYKFDIATLTVLLLAFAVILTVVIAAAFVGNKGGSDKETTPPELTFPDISDVPQRDNITVTHADNTLEEIYEKDGIEYIYSFISYPFLEGGNPDATAKINDAIFAFAGERVTIKSFEKTNAEDAYNRSEQDAVGFIEFEFITRAESVYVKDGYVSIMFRRVRTVGISEPKEDITTLCFDLISGDEADISGFMNVDADTARSFILDIFSQHIKINPKLYYNDALETLPDIVDLKSFYLTENGVILYFNPDIITPSVMGVRDFTVPYDKTGH